MDTMEYFKFFTDLWRFFRRHLADRDLGAAATESMELAKHYGETEFACQMAVAAVDEIERIVKNPPKI